MLKNTIRSRRTRCLLLAAMVVTCLLPIGGHAVEHPTAGTGNRRARDEAIAAIPWQQLHPQLANTLQSLVRHPSIYRRMPVSFVECDPQLHHFLVRNPEALVSIWQSLGITNVTVARPSRTAFHADDGMGTFTQLHLVYASPDVHLYYGTGHYDGDLVPGRVQGHGAVLIRSQAFRRPDGTAIVRDTMDIFIKIDSGPLDVAAKTFHPLFMKYADVNFMDSTEFVERLSYTAQKHPEAMQQWVQRLPNLAPPVRHEFAQVVGQLTPLLSTDANPVSHQEPPAAQHAQWVNAHHSPADGRPYP